MAPEPFTDLRKQQFTYHNGWFDPDGQLPLCRSLYDYFGNKIKYGINKRKAADLTHFNTSTCTIVTICSLVTNFNSYLFEATTFKM